ncbi:glycosyltransferase family 39 protein [Halosimplex halophilum]|uniref:glycosyltransferase family 39 protein n=1 Tax=Halosimplex halophilum TaxID=2559572 RepID=UPI00107F7D3D|nr:glycosyltransferase family 39 protein [Halosimplex halophilum]
MPLHRTALGRSIGRRIGRTHALVFAVALALRAWLWSRTGSLVVRDAHRYIEWCGQLSASTLFGSRALVYSGYWLPYCGWLRATGEFVDGWVALQVVLSALACVLVCETARLLVDARAGLVAGLLLAVQWEVYKWVVRPQSEFMLAFAVALALWRLTAYHLSATRRNRVLALAALGFVALVRPNGLVIVLGYLAYDFLPASSGRRLNLFFPAPVNVALAGALGSFALYRLSFGLYHGNTVLSPWKEGVVITPERFVYDYTPAPADGVVEFLVRNAEHVVAIAGLRGLWFFAPVLPGWSVAHAVKTGVTLTPLTVLGLLGVYRAARTDRELLVLWGTPLAMVVLTAMAVWVAGWRNFLGPAAVVYALFAGYFVSAAGRSRRVPLPD